MNVMVKPGIRFEINVDKCIEGIDLIARRKPNITQYYVCKIFYFADREHLLDWGRMISGDRFVAMQHGPVPSFVYNLLKDSVGEPDEIVDRLNDRVKIARKNNKLLVKSRGKNEFGSLSKTDIEYLEAATEKYSGMSFGAVKAISHQDPAYNEAWSKPGQSNEMDLSLWFSGDEWDKDEVIAELQERSRIASNSYT